MLFEHEKSSFCTSAHTAFHTGETWGGLDGNTSAGDYDMFLTKISTIPEPGSITLLLCGMASLALLRRRR